MPIVKCTGCGKMGYETAPVGMSAQEMARLVWLKAVACRHCGKKKLVRAVFGQDYGYREDGTRFGNDRIL